MSAVILGKWKRKRTWSILRQLSECPTRTGKRPVDTFFFELEYMDKHNIGGKKVVSPLSISVDINNK
jgi:hypothetical protein